MTRFIRYALFSMGICLGAVFLAVLATGGFQLPFTSLRLEYPCTVLFLLLLCIGLYQGLTPRAIGRSWTEHQENGLLLVVIWLVYLVNFRWRGSGDVVAASLQPFALLKHGTLYLDDYYKTFLSNQRITWVYEWGTHILSMYPSLEGLLLVPFYAITVLSGVAPTDALIHQLQKIGASCMVVLSAWWLLLVLTERIPRRWAIWITIAYALGTGSWATSSQAIWQHGPSQMFLMLGIYALLKGEDVRSQAATPWPFGWFGVSGFAFAMAVWARYPTLLRYGPMLAYMLHRHRNQDWKFLTASVPPFLCLMADNYFHSGNVLFTGYSGDALRFTATPWVGMAGLLVSPSRGLLLYSPWLIFALWGLIRSWRVPGFLFWRYLSLSVGFTILFYGFYTFWTGGWCFGPRYLAGLSPILALGIIPILPDLEKSARLKTLFAASVAYSIVIQAVGAFFTWWWEVPPPPPWSWSSYPPFYLFKQLRFSHFNDQAQAAWATWFLLAALAVWFLRQITKLQPSVS